jgi:hypothetical protein
MTIGLFQTKISRLGRTYRWYVNLVTDLQAMVTALGTDITTRDITLQAPPIAVKPGHGNQPGVTPHSKLTNAAAELINEGKASGLTVAAMATAITNTLTNILPPTVATAPVASGTGTVGQTLSCTTGAWNFAPVSYRYQWQRGGAAIPGAINPTYVLVAADSGKSVSCMVFASNPAGFSSGSSNAIAVA